MSKSESRTSDMCVFHDFELLRYNSVFRCALMYKIK